MANTGEPLIGPYDTQVAVAETSCRESAYWGTCPQLVCALHFVAVWRLGNTAELSVGSQ